MDDKNFKLAESIINPSYVRLGENSISKRQKIMKQLLSQRQLPMEGLDDLTIRYFLDEFALMDSNNFDHKIGVGERQSRIFSRMVTQRHFYMGHGIGRSGDIMANQPKAAGSSLLLQLTRYLIVSALHQLNYQFVEDVLVLPLATGMSISMALLTLSQMQPQRKYVIWSRIDQKTCLKSILTANLIPIVVQLKAKGDSLVNDLEKIEQLIKQYDSKILAVVTTTSCFAPRIPDQVDEVSLIAKKHGIFHLVNNAYGVWCSKIANKIKEGMRKGQCTIVVQSTDKNLMVPVGGSFIFTNNQKVLEKSNVFEYSVSAKYPGRANGSPIVDLFITLLSMGKETLKVLKKQRKQNFELMKNSGKQFAQKHNCSIIQTPANSISIAMNINIKELKEEQLTQLGAILYSKRVMGHRILVNAQKVTKIGKLEFKNYGSHCDKYQKLPYITFACAVGTKKEEITLFFQRLHQAFKQLVKKKKKIQKKVSQKIEEVQKTQKKIQQSAQ